MTSPYFCGPTTFASLTETSIPSIDSQKSIPSSAGSNEVNLSLSITSVGGESSSHLSAAGTGFVPILSIVVLEISVVDKSTDFMSE